MPSILDTIRAALKKPAATTAQLATALDQARRAETDARAAVEAAGDAFKAGALDDDATRQKKRAALFDARTAADDVAMLHAEAERRHVAALAADEEARRAALYRAGTEASAAAAAVLAKEYPRAARAILGILGQLACAQQTVAAANAELPTGAEPIADPETVARGTPSLPREVLSDEVVERWCHIGSHEPLGEAYQGEIYAVGYGFGKRGQYDGGTGSSGEGDAGYRLHRFRRVEFREPVYASAPLSLAAALHLPALRGDGMLWGHTFGISDPAEVLAALTEIEAAASGKPEPVRRAVRVTMENLGDVKPLAPEPPREDTTRVKSTAAPSKAGASPFNPGRAVAGGRR